MSFLLPPPKYCKTRVQQCSFFHPECSPIRLRTCSSDIFPTDAFTRCFQARSTTLCTLNEFICMVPPVLCTSALHIHWSGGANHTALIWLRMKTAPFVGLFVLLFPNDIKFAFVFTNAIEFLSFLIDGVFHAFLKARRLFCSVDITSDEISRQALGYSSRARRGGKKRSSIDLERVSKQEKRFNGGQLFVARASFCQL